METSTCQVPRNVLLLVVARYLRCNNQKEGQDEGPTIRVKREEALGLEKRNENRADNSVRIGKNTITYHY